MFNDKKKIDVGFIIKTRDENGQVMTRVTPEGKTIPDPLVFTRNFGSIEDVEVNVSFWDLDAETLTPLMSGNPSDIEREAFFRKMHGRMQELVASGDIASNISDHAARRRIAQLEAQIRANGGTPVSAND